MKAIGNYLSVFVFVFSTMLLSGQDKSGKPIIGIIAGGEETFWKTFYKGSDAAAADLGYAIKRPAVTADANYLQIKSVQEMAMSKVKAIIVSPLDNRELVRPLKDAEAKGIKIVLVETKLRFSSYLSFLSVDNYNVGKLCAKKMAQLLGGKGKVIVIPFSPDNESTLQREKGFIEELKKCAPEITIYPLIQYGGPNYQQATYITASVLTQYSFADGFFCSEELTTHSMLNALSARKIAINKKLVGYGINEALLAGLKNGKVDALAISDPYALGYESVKLIDMSLKGEKIKNRIEFPVFIIDKDSLKKENIKKLVVRQIPDAFKVVPPPPAPAKPTPVPVTTPAPAKPIPAPVTAPVTTVDNTPAVIIAPVSVLTTTVIPIPVRQTVIIVNPEHRKKRDSKDPHEKKKPHQRPPVDSQKKVPEQAVPAKEPTIAPVTKTTPLPEPAVSIFQPTQPAATSPTITTQVPEKPEVKETKKKSIFFPARTESDKKVTPVIPAK